MSRNIGSSAMLRSVLARQRDQRRLPALVEMRAHAHTAPALPRSRDANAQSRSGPASSRTMPSRNGTRSR